MFWDTRRTPSGIMDSTFLVGPENEHVVDVPSSVDQSTPRQHRLGTHVAGGPVAETIARRGVQHVYPSVRSGREHSVAGDDRCSRADTRLEGPQAVAGRRVNGFRLGAPPGLSLDRRLKTRVCARSFYHSPETQRGHRRQTVLRGACPPTGARLQVSPLSPGRSTPRPYVDRRSPTPDAHLPRTPAWPGRPPTAPVVRTRRWSSASGRPPGARGAP